jgi:adenylosuccinate synthase
MPVVAIIGAQWGDEGKGKIVDLLAAKAQVVVRSQGGANAGHTIQRDGKTIILHLLPSGVLTAKTTCLIGPGVVLDPELFATEIAAVETPESPLQDRLMVDFRTHLVFPTHKQLDACLEKALGTGKIGTTSRGIGPAYSDKAIRRGVRVGDLLDADRRKKCCEALLDYHFALLEKVYHETPPDKSDLMEQCDRWAELLSRYAGDTVRRLQEAVEQDQMILLEGAQGTFLDLDLGTYPYVTSSHPTVGGAVVGLGIAPKRIDYVLGVLKAYCTRVGSGPFPTEADAETAELIRKRGGEYGSTTGRPRRIGWLDLVAAREAVKYNGVDGWAITKLDVLENLDTIKICSKYTLDGTTDSCFPATTADWEKVEPVYEQMSGWQGGSSAREFEELPEKAQAYLNRIRDFTGVPVQLVSLGADQEATILPRVEIGR